MEKPLGLWLIKRIDEVGYDENVGYVIAARLVRTVREIAAKAGADEGEGPWLAPERSKVVRIGEAILGTRQGIILTSFKAG
jgi:hypothetical protein